MLAIKSGFAALDLQTGKFELVATPEAHLPHNRFNDGKCDPAGRFWAGTMCMDERGEPVGALYMLDTDLSCKQMLTNIGISNGIAWSPDGSTMYYIDSMTYRVDAYDFDVSTGAISNRRTIIRMPKELGLPDGCCVDSDGNLWVALWGGSSVVCYDPRTGEPLRKVHVATPKASSCWFGGADRDTLYITTAKRTHTQRGAGALYAVRIPGVTGLPCVPFAG